MTSSCHNNNEEDPHTKYINHIKNGGRILRVDSMNNTVEIFKLDNFKDPSRIRNYGFNDLIMIDDDTINASEILNILLNRKSERIITIQSILFAICDRYKQELRDCTYITEKLWDGQINIDSDEGCSWQFQIEYVDENTKKIQLHATMLLDDGNFILTIYPDIVLVSPFKQTELYDGVHTAAQQELMDRGVMAWNITVDELENS